MAVRLAYNISERLVNLHTYYVNCPLINIQFAKDTRFWFPIDHIEMFQIN